MLIMASVDLALFKKHVRADDFADDDEYLEHLLLTAKEAVLNAANRKEDEVLVDGKLPSSITHAIMVLAGHWYNQRESVSTAQMYEVPDSLNALIKPFQKLVDDASRENEI